jgi:hypothetical protein
MFACAFIAEAQIVPSSPARWLYPNGNLEATRHQTLRSGSQLFDTIKLKWKTPFLSGQIQPLVGNIVDNRKLSIDNPYSPNEIVALVGGRLIVIDATGRTIVDVSAPDFARQASLIIDSLAMPSTLYGRFSSMVALETIEAKDADSTNSDSLCSTYIFAYDNINRSFDIIKQLTLDVRPYTPNLFASIRPVYARRNPTNTASQIHCIVSMSSPDLFEPKSTPYFRGATQFLFGNDETILPTLPSGDTLPWRFTLAPEITFSTPSITTYGNNNRIGMLFPTFPSRFDISIPNSFRPAIPTFSNRPYLASIDLQGNQPAEGIVPVDLSSLNDFSQNTSRPRMKPYYLKLNDGGANGIQRQVVLLAEEYLGRDSSIGRARLHLYQTNGDAITSPSDPLSPAFNGGFNHNWSIGTGDIDGIDTNRFLPAYPNNPGEEIVVTQTTRDLAYAGSKLMVLRYRTGALIQKTSPRNSFLFPFDTIVTYQITGWLACVADIDNNGDGKEEIFIADGNSVYVLRMRNYIDGRFRSGHPFDTVLTYSYPGEIVYHVLVSDVDGDGLSDILITTNLQSYLYGQPSNNSISITNPSRTLSSTQAQCIGDSASLAWFNVFRGQSTVSVQFQEYRSGAPFGNPISLATTLDNSTDSLRFTFLPGAQLSGKTGRYIVQSLNSQLVRDSSALVRFDAPTMRFSQETKSRVYVSGARAGYVSGTGSCLDTIRLYGSVDSGRSWQLLETRFIPNTNTDFSFEPVFPCAKFYNALGDRDSICRLRAEGLNNRTNVTVYSDTISVKMKPREIDARIYPSQLSVGRERQIAWSLLLIDSTICPTVTLAISYDKGKSFKLLERLPRSQSEYLYRPSSIEKADTVILRISCDSTCWRTDSLILNAKPALIHAVTPNPFEPTIEVCEIFSALPVTTTVTVRLYDQNNRVVREIIANDLRTANQVYTDTWDGTNDSGEAVAMGMYYVVISGSDGSREFYPVYVKKR